jgi:hypothetical protein
MQKMRTAKKYFGLCNAGAEDAHLPKIFWFYATAMQKIHIYKGAICLCSPIGWMGGGRFPTFHRTK